MKLIFVKQRPFAKIAKFITREIKPLYGIDTCTLSGTQAHIPNRHMAKKEERHATDTRTKKPTHIHVYMATHHSYTLLQRASNTCTCVLSFLTLLAI